MTPRIGFLKRAALGVALSSGLAMGCAIEIQPEDLRLEQGFADTLPYDVSRPDKSLVTSPIEESLERLEALEVLDVNDLVTTRTQHVWIPYGGFWSSSEQEMGEEELAQRLASFVQIAEAAVASVDSISTDAEGLCWGADEFFCLTKDAHADDLSALNNLEIVDVAGVIRETESVDGVCYSSWDAVTEDVCLRALKAHAIVEATADFPTRTPPEGDGW